MRGAGERVDAEALARQFFLLRLVGVEAYAYGLTDVYLAVDQHWRRARVTAADWRESVGEWERITRHLRHYKSDK
jgi:hypothetical protein